MDIEPIDHCRHVPPGTGPNANVLDALFDMICFVPENPPVQFTTLAAEHHVAGHEAMSPFFSESYLYPLLGKEDARTLLGHMRRVLESLGFRASEAIDLMQDEISKRWIGTVRAQFDDIESRDRFITYLRSEARYPRLIYSWRAPKNESHIDFHDVVWADKVLIDTLVGHFGMGTVSVVRQKFRSVWRQGLSFRANSPTYCHMAKTGAA
jgi:hypothetical protein